MSIGRTIRLALLGLLLPAVLHAQRIGEFSVRVGAATAAGTDSVVTGTGPAVEASFGTRFGRVVILLEGGYLGVSAERHAWRYGVGARYEFGTAAWRPYAVVGLGGYDDKGRRLENVEGQVFTSDLSWFGVNAGGGVRREFAGSPWGVTAEARMHVRMQQAFPENDTVGLELVTLLLGGVVSW